MMTNNFKRVILITTDEQKQQIQQRDFEGKIAMSREIN